MKNASIDERRVSNERLATGALRNGWQWAHSSPGFIRPKPGFPDKIEVRPAESEQHVFQIAGLEYLEPWQR